MSVRSATPADSVHRVLGAALLALALAACRRDMQDQPRYQPFEVSGFFADGRAARPLVPGTVARGHLNEDVVFATGKTASGYTDALPVALDRALLARGRERYDIYCSPCHDRVGNGAGMIVQRGYKRPTSLHDERLRSTPVGYFFDVMTNGFGVMPSYAVQIPPHDRWAIAAYVRALQLSQRARASDVPAAERPRLDRAGGEDGAHDAPDAGGAYGAPGAPSAGRDGAAETTAEHGR